ncbi:bromodomain adjacent to zinc finger domain protein 1A-like [Tubulanus polymorphus]|uniref:bromodomain adjacent to zinc finger domain protein 1A-like n=1 Tax=Tubulanus polymorphus TaxID=672921 RepID=UPI003DA469EE
MPLLRRQPFVRKKPPADLRPDEEVFFCKLTNEIFRDYEEFFERIILCNSLVWSCSITGRPNLTFQEALETEEKARKHLASFPTYLQRPVLYLSTLTHRTRLNDMNDDVFLFTKDRFFKGELVEVYHRNMKKTCRILNVIPPLIQKKPESITQLIDLTNSSDEDEEENDDKKTMRMKEDNLKPDKYSYLVQVQGKQDTFTVKSSNINRKKGLFTRDKSKLFLKQHCEAGDGVWRVKEQYNKQFKLKEMVFDSFFAGPPPHFAVSKVKRKPGAAATTSGNVDHLLKSKKQLKQEKKERKKLEKDDNKSGGAATFEDMTPAEKEAFKERLKAEKKAMKDKYRDDLKKKLEEEKIKRKEERDKEREKRREEDRIRAEYLREWCKPRDDLECDDLQLLPEPQPINCKIPTSLFGDAVMLLEFFVVFEEVLAVKETFPDGVSFGLIERALTETDPNQTPLADILIFILNSIFKLQEEEAEEENALLKDNQIGDLPDMNEDISDISTKLLVESATRAAQWPMLYHATPLKKFSLDSFNLTEVLRLHFLSSGAETNPLDAKFCYQERGGYTPYDDAGLQFRRQENQLMKTLATDNVFDLQPDEKLKILHALMNQLLTYAAVRDIIDDHHERMKQTVSDLRNTKINEVRREKDEASARWKRRAIEKTKERERNLAEQAKKIQDKEEQLKTSSEQQQQSAAVPASSDDSTTTEESKYKSGRLNDKKRLQEEASILDEIKDKDLLSLRDLDEDSYTAFQKEIIEKKRHELELETKEEFRRRINELNDEIYNLQFTNALLPIGRDRMFRRYWVFKSMPGLFIENYETYLPADYINPVPQINANPYKRENMANGLPGAGAAAVGKPAPTEEKNGGSDKENESFEATNRGENDETKEEYSRRVVEQITRASRVNWCYLSSVDELDELLSALNSRGVRENALKQALIDQKEKIIETVKSCPVTALNSGNDATLDSKDKTQHAKLQNIKSRNRTIQGAVKNDSGQEIMELSLREMVLDLEERIYTGSLGCLKVKNRFKWRDAIESGSFDVQQDNLTWTGKIDSMETSQIDEMTESNQSTVSQVVKDLSRAVLQISQCLEEKYLIPPLGEDKDNTKKGGKKADSKGKNKKDEPMEEDGNDDVKQMTCRERWEQSLMLSMSLSQIFLHLSTLECSIAWTKSALHARCRICRRKGDAEKMLLCDGCDKGHHMYCLKPAMKHVPTGDWFCPACRPKDHHRSPRKQRSKVREETDDETEDDSDEDDGSSSNSSDSSNSSSDNSSEEEETAEDDDDDDENEEEMEEEEEVKKPTRMGFRIRGKADSRPTTPTETIVTKRRSKGGSGKNTPASGRSTPTEATSKRRSGSSQLNGKRKSDSFIKESRPGKRSKQNTPNTPASEGSNFSNARKNETFQMTKQLQTLLADLVKHENSWPFLRPVSKRDAPDYHDFIKNPMDFSTVRAKLNKYEYSGTIEVIDDIRLIFKNCEEYNRPEADEFKCGISMSKYFEKQIRQQKLLGTGSRGVKRQSSGKGHDVTPTGRRSTRKT